ncbi:relaxase/mobilization nuclease domain-containing protein [Acinetobacter baumannii]|uniref:relaxase/mobilization nuclease domain-containing protein n=1 Tax=Acinetobacter baumannii TaxID=470 RepID=UPI00054C2821|nr:ABC transporter permease [Acinetobacter baumannii]
MANGSSKTTREVQSTLLAHGEQLLNGSKVRCVNQTQSLDTFLNDLSKPKNGSGHSATSAPKSSPNSVKATLDRISKKTPEVMVKVTGGGNSMGKVKAHMGYITRNGQLEGIDQDGNKVNGKDDIEDAAEDWQMSGTPISDEESKYKQAFNIVLSMPKGTDEKGVYDAAKEFAEEHFKDHKYMMVQHTFTNDPSKDPSENPHVHVVVKAVSEKGDRLNIRKADLQEWRESFAEKLRARGIEANATKRIARLQKNRSDKQSVKQMKEQGKSFKRYGKNKASPERVQKAKQQEKEALTHYKEITKALSQSPDPQDRKLAVDLVDYLRKQVEVKKPMSQPQIQPNKLDLQHGKNKGKEQDR